MVDLYQRKAVWSGMTGQPGVTTFYTTSKSDAGSTAIATFFTAIKGLIPAAVTIDVLGTGITIDSTTGKAVNSWSTTVPPSIVCTGTGAYAAAAGAVITWTTGAYINGRQLLGRTFIVPLVASNFGNNGLLLIGQQGLLFAAADTLRGMSDGLTIWSRRRAAVATAGRPKVPNTGAILRSRRD